jgi:hypothetical protein
MVNPPDRQTRRQTIASVLWGLFSILCGWSLFIYWWAYILTETQTAIVLRLLEQLATLAGILVLIAFGWVAHNRRQAKRGGRGNATRFRAPVFETDHLNRRLVLPAADALRSSPELRVSTIDSKKVYDAARL